MRPLLALALGLVTVPALAQQPRRPKPALQPQPAQQPRPAQPESSYCNVQIDSSHGQSHYLKAPNGAYDTYAGGGMWAHCLNQPATTMYSDSLAWFPEQDLLYLIGHVHFRDSVSLLDADRVTYYLRQERLYAEGSVFTRNRHTGSDLRGPNLDYYRVSPPLRDTALILANQRPTIHFHSASRASAADTEPFVVVADRVRMLGDDRMWGGGHLTIDRSDLAAAGDSGQLDLTGDVGSLLGAPQVDGKGNDAYHMKGRRIDFTLTPSHEIHHAVSKDSADARGPDWRLTADTLDMTLDSGKVQLAEAWGRRRRPDAVSGLHTIIADSLDIHMPDQLVRLVWAYGNARSVTRDSTGPNEDWLTGDTLRADFAVVHDSASTRPKSDLQHVTSFGSARALYHVDASDTTVKNRKGINYSRGRRIDIAMLASKVQSVDVVGQTDGVYLEPVPPPRDTTHRADTTHAGADTTRAARPDTTRGAHPDTTRARDQRHYKRGVLVDSAGHPIGPPDSTAHPVPVDSAARPASRDTTAHPVPADATPRPATPPGRSARR